MKIIAAAHDPGGANAVAASVHSLIQSGFIVHSYAKGPAAAQFRRLKVPFRETPVQHQTILSEFDADLLLTGVSNEDSFERDATLWARANNVPSVAIMDYWLNYKGRFTRSGVSVLPDIIIAIDETCRSEMVNEGLSNDRIRVLGQPYFGWLAVHASSGKTDLRKSGEFLFASQNNPWEEELLVRLFGTLQVRPDFKVLRIRMHPRFTDWMSVREIVESAEVAIEFDTLEDPLESIRRHELVLGTKSILLIEAAMQGVPAGSIVWEDEDPLKTNELGLTLPLRSSKELANFLVNPRVGEKREIFSQRHKGAAERVAKLCLEIVGK